MGLKGEAHPQAELHLALSNGKDDVGIEDKGP
jgi:hypothetical protein